MLYSKYSNLSERWPQIKSLRPVFTNALKSDIDLEMPFLYINYISMNEKGSIERTENL